MSGSLGYFPLSRFLRTTRDGHRFIKFPKADRACWHHWTGGAREFGSGEACLLYRLYKNDMLLSANVFGELVGVEVEGTNEVGGTDDC